MISKILPSWLWLYKGHYVLEFPFLLLIHLKQIYVFALQSCL